MSSLARSFMLCADDYGWSPGVGRAVRALVAAGRLSAVSCMTTTPHWPEEGARLRPLADRVEVGLHLNLTDGEPLGPMPQFAPDGRLPPLPALVDAVLRRRTGGTEIADECGRQLDRLSAVIGRPPDFVDGHRHVHQMPLIRRALLDVLLRRHPRQKPWLRVASQSVPEIAGHPAPTAGKALAVTLLGAGFRRVATRHGFASNQHFRGLRRFRGEPPFAHLFARFIRDIRPGTLVMCHPGTAEAEEDDPGHPAALRAEEFAFLSSDALPLLLQSHDLALARFPAF